MALSFRLEAYLAEREITPYRLAQLIGMTPSGVYKLQRAKRLDLETLGALCDALDCTPADLFAYTPPPRRRKAP